LKSRWHLDRSHVVIQGPTQIGLDNRIFQFASLGEMPRKKYGGEPDPAGKLADRQHHPEFVTSIAAPCKMPG